MPMSNCDVKVVLLLLLVPTMSNAGGACSVRFVKGKLIRNRDCEQHDVIGILDDIRKRAEKEIKRPTTKPPSEAVSSRVTTPQQSTTANMTQDSVHPSDGSRFFMKIFPTQNVNLTMANKTCYENRSRLANIDEQQARGLGILLGRRYCSTGRESVPPQVVLYTGLTYKNGQMYNSFDEIVKFNGWQMAPTINTPIALLIDCSARFTNYISADKFDGVICETG